MIMNYITLTNRALREAHYTINVEHIVLIEDNRFSTSSKDFAWTNVWLTTGKKLEVVETENEILLAIQRLYGI